MTEKALERGIELKGTMDSLWKRREKLKSMKALCSENMDIAKSKTHRFDLDASKKEGGRNETVTLSAGAAYAAICKDIEKTEEELEKLQKEFSDL